MAKQAPVRRHRKRLITAEDLLCLVGVADANLSSDGTRMAFVRKVVDERRQVAASIWCVEPAEAAGPRALTFGSKDTSPRFAPDGTRIAFLRGSDEKGAQIAVLPLDGGEARPLTRFPEGSLRSLKWSPSGTHLAVAFRPTEEGWTKKDRKERERRGDVDPPRILDSRWNRLDGDGWFGPSRYALYLVDARTGRYEELYSLDSMGMFDFDWSPDGTRIILSTNRDQDALFKPWRDELAILNLEEGTLAPIEGLPIGPKTSVAWSPDGKRLAWAGRTGRDGVYSTENLEIWSCGVPDAKGRISAKGGKPRSLTHVEDFCVAAATLSDCADAAFDAVVRWRRDSQAILTRVGRHGEGQLVEVPLDGRRSRFLTDGRYEYALANLSADGKHMAAIRTDAVTPAEVGLLTLPAKAGKATWRPLTRFNHAMLEAVELASPSEHWVESADGHRVHTWILEPPAIAPKPTRGKGARRPAVIEVHGGPHAQYGVAFFHEMQLLAAQGYVVAYSNPRGSKGYGREHCAAIRGNWGDKDWIDVQAVTDFVAGRKDVNPKRIGIMGGSYGGYMTNWAIGHSKAYRAAITDRCVSNLLSFAGNSDYPLIPGEYWPGTNFERPEALWRSSPIAYLKGVDTPTLIIHSEGDFRCNIEQSEQVHTALALQGVPCRFVRYPASTSHGMSRSGPPELRLHRLGEILAWWKRWLE